MNTRINDSGTNRDPLRKFVWDRALGVDRTSRGKVSVRLHPTPRYVLKELVIRATWSGFDDCYSAEASYKYLCEGTSLSEDTVINAVKYLEHIGLVTKRQSTTPDGKVSERNDYAVHVGLELPAYVHSTRHYGEFLKELRDAKGSPTAGEPLPESRGTQEPESPAYRGTPPRLSGDIKQYQAEVRPSRGNVRAPGTAEVEVEQKLPREDLVNINPSAGKPTDAPEVPWIELDGGVVVLNAPHDKHPSAPAFHGAVRAYLDAGFHPMTIVVNARATLDDVGDFEKVADIMLDDAQRERRSASRKKA